MLKFHEPILNFYEMVNIPYKMRNVFCPQNHKLKLLHLADDSAEDMLALQNNPDQYSHTAILFQSNAGIQSPVN